MIFQLMDIRRCVVSGHYELDTQQAEFVERGNRYLRAYASGMQNAILEPTLVYLSEYVKDHFQTQETFMRSNSYPGIDLHVSHHAEYIKKVAQIFKALLSWKSTQNPEAYANLALNMCMIISDWFEFHILNNDTRLNEFILYEVRGKERS